MSEATTSKVKWTASGKLGTTTGCCGNVSPTAKAPLTVRSEAFYGDGGRMSDGNYLDGA